MYRTVGFLLIGILFTTFLQAQDTLPHFSATARGPGKILISWHNRYASVSQISIQRSTDSTKNFTTLITVPDPRLPENGAMDSKAPHPNFYYRLFIVLDNGKYLFTPSRRPRSSTGESPTVVKEADDDETSISKMAGTSLHVFCNELARERHVGLKAYENGNLLTLLKAIYRKDRLTPSSRR